MTKSALTKMTKKQLIEEMGSVRLEMAKLEERLIAAKVHWRILEEHNKAIAALVSKRALKFFKEKKVKG